ncbi:uncharacterized protein CLUP02_02201 [Colletotrichum lupini]|uniref:Uncharacterized protein n=1 Tax=Colletotrichum lupini TaxID=145971 RepID=A0A9Q8WAE9_9PEZI|nr:uncharacterized protein CLUP02_02201 [Colletotrichum lupini]UQC75547.1 hypothetical protein CLUP02_02201 [Colletotrichum lupini]
MAEVADKTFLIYLSISRASNRKFGFVRAASLTVQHKEIDLLTIKAHRQASHLTHAIDVRYQQGPRFGAFRPKEGERISHKTRLYHQQGFSRHVLAETLICPPESYREEENHPRRPSSALESGQNPWTGWHMAMLYVEGSAEKLEAALQQSQLLERLLRAHEIESPCFGDLEIHANKRHRAALSPDENKDHGNFGKNTRDRVTSFAHYTLEVRDRRKEGGTHLGDVLRHISAGNMCLFGPALTLLEPASEFPLTFYEVVLLARKLDTLYKMALSFCVKGDKPPEIYDTASNHPFPIDKIAQLARRTILKADGDKLRTPGQVKRFQRYPDLHLTITGIFFKNSRMTWLKFAEWRAGSIGNLLKKSTGYVWTFRNGISTIRIRFGGRDQRKADDDESASKGVSLAVSLTKRLREVALDEFIDRVYEDSDITKEDSRGVDRVPIANQILGRIHSRSLIFAEKSLPKTSGMTSRLHLYDTSPSTSAICLFRQKKESFKNLRHDFEWNSHNLTRGCIAKALQQIMMAQDANRVKRAIGGALNNLFLPVIAYSEEELGTVHKPSQAKVQQSCGKRSVTRDAVQVHKHQGRRSHKSLANNKVSQTQVTPYVHLKFHAKSKENQGVSETQIAPNLIPI